VICRLRDEGYRVAVHGLPPASNKEFITALPFSGKPRERNEIFRVFNRKLGDFCRSAGVVFVDVQSIACDGQGYFNKRYLADEVHCNSRIVPFARQAIMPLLRK